MWENFLAEVISALLKYSHCYTFLQEVPSHLYTLLNARIAGILEAAAQSPFCQEAFVLLCWCAAVTVPLVPLAFPVVTVSRPVLAAWAGSEFLGVTSHIQLICFSSCDSPNSADVWSVALTVNEYR